MRSIFRSRVVGAVLVSLALVVSALLAVGLGVAAALCWGVKLF